ncbi:MAG: hypothetical protein EPO61_04095 [Nitrospirae bacterium]|nr:MAG: hypothetical protein EPO61_04095 [Nitrospirota bacterium]
MEIDELTLRDFVIWAAKAGKEKRLDKTQISHKFAQAVRGELTKAGATAEPLKSGNANYFRASFDGTDLLISAFASQENWWNEPSDGFMDLVKKAKTTTSSCRWGVVLLRVPEMSGYWIEGASLQETYGDWRKKFTESNMKQIVKQKSAHEFLKLEQLPNLIRRGRLPGSILIKKTAT